MNFVLCPVGSKGDEVKYILTPSLPNQIFLHKEEVAPGLDANVDHDERFLYEDHE